MVPQALEESRSPAKQLVAALKKRQRAWRTPPRRQLDRFLRSHASDALTLDVGCGSAPYASLYPKRIGVDLKAHRGVQVCADVSQLPFADGTFDVVLCTEVLEHVPNPPAAVRELHRVLRRGGKCLLSTRFAYPIHDEVDYYRFTRRALESLFRAWEELHIAEDTSGWATLVTFVHYWLGEKKTWPWKPAKALWFLFLQAWPESANGSVPSRVLPSGYHVVACKGQGAPENKPLAKGGYSRPH
jgi:SAM-dependent methyltransferase